MAASSSSMRPQAIHGCLTSAMHPQLVVLLQRQGCVAPEPEADPAPLSSAARAARRAVPQLHPPPACAPQQQQGEEAPHQLQQEAPPQQQQQQGEAPPAAPQPPALPTSCAAACAPHGAALAGEAVAWRLGPLPAHLDPSACPHAAEYAAFAPLRCTCAGCVAAACSLTARAHALAADRAASASAELYCQEPLAAPMLPCFGTLCARKLGALRAEHEALAADTQRLASVGLQLLHFAAADAVALARSLRRLAAQPRGGLAEAGLPWLPAGALRQLFRAAAACSSEGGGAEGGAASGARSALEDLARQALPEDLACAPQTPEGTRPAWVNAAEALALPSPVAYALAPSPHAALQRLGQVRAAELRSGWEFWGIALRSHDSPSLSSSSSSSSSSSPSSIRALSAACDASCAQQEESLRSLCAVALSSAAPLECHLVALAEEGAPRCSGADAGLLDGAWRGLSLLIGCGVMGREVLQPGGGGGARPPLPGLPLAGAGGTGRAPSAFSQLQLQRSAAGSGALDLCLLPPPLREAACAASLRCEAEGLLEVRSEAWLRLQPAPAPDADAGAPPPMPPAELAFWQGSVSAGNQAEAALQWEGGGRAGGCWARPPLPLQRRCARCRAAAWWTPASPASCPRQPPRLACTWGGSGCASGSRARALRGSWPWTWAARPARGCAAPPCPPRACAAGGTALAPRACRQQQQQQRARGGRRPPLRRRWRRAPWRRR